jgi:hypothetical protein
VSTLRLVAIGLLAAMLGGCPERYTRPVQSPNAPAAREDPECDDSCATMVCPPGFTCSANSRNCRAYCRQRKPYDDPRSGYGTGW